jgi:hypothetical protein
MVRGVLFGAAVFLLASVVVRDKAAVEVVLILALSAGAGIWKGRSVRKAPDGRPAA